MKKILFLLGIIGLLTVFFATAADKNPDINPQKDFHFVEKPEPVPENMKQGFESITARDAESYLRFLSSDLLAGRDAGSPTYDIAAEFAAALFRLWGLQPAGDLPPRQRPKPYDKPSPNAKKQPERTYLQDVLMEEFFKGEDSISCSYRKGSSAYFKTFQPDIDFMDSSAGTGRIEEISAPVVFVGFGIEEKSLNFNEFQGLDVKGKIVIKLSGIPRDDKEDSPFRQGKLKDKYYPTIQQIRSQGWGDTGLKLLKEKGALAVLEVSPSPQGTSIAQVALRLKNKNDEEPIHPEVRRKLSLLADDDSSLPQESVSNFWISYEMGNYILTAADNCKTDSLETLAKKINHDFKPQSRVLDGVFITIKTPFKTRLVKSCNVLGYLEGSDPELKKEVVVIGAHLDGLGKIDDYIFNGANDNGSGSAAVLELAQAFAINPVKPKRSILFALWAAEERGLLGSRFYVAHPYFPQSKTTAYLNMDMIGWEWEDKETLTGIFRRGGYEVPAEIMEKIDLANFLMPSLARDSVEMYETLKNCGRYLGFTLFLRKSGGLIGGSDFSSFARENIPWTHIITGGGKYTHHPGDSIDKINFDIIRKVAQFVYTAAFTLADK